MPSAPINLTVGTFRDITTTTDTPRWSTVSALEAVATPGQTRVTVPTGTTKLVVTGSGAIDLVFTILSSANDTSTYTPLGVWFVQTSGTQDPHGVANFSLQAITSSTITIRNLHVNSGPATAGPKWEYFLVIQRQDGKIGIIDPDIENDN